MTEFPLFVRSGSMSDSISAQMERILDEYSAEVKQANREADKVVSKNCANKIRSTAAKKTGEYASGWTSKQLDADTYVVYNKKMPGLAHLLEHGHVIRNKKGEYGRTSGDGKIAVAEQEAEVELVETIERKLR